MSGAFANHLWQSTVFALAVGLLTVAFRENQARVRYWLWFSTSVKFFIPFSLLVSLGGKLPWAPTAQRIAPPVLSVTMAQISQPFLESGASSLTPATPGPADWIRIVALSAWACGFVVIILMRLQMWRRVRNAVHASAAIDLPSVAMPPSLQVRAAPGLLEPGVVGFWRPILLLPCSPNHSAASHRARVSRADILGPRRLCQWARTVLTRRSVDYRWLILDCGCIRTSVDA